MGISWFIAGVIVGGLAMGLAEMIRQARKPEPPPSPFSHGRESEYKLRGVPERLRPDDAPGIRN